VVIVGGSIARLIAALTAAKNYKVEICPKKIKVTEAILKTKKKILQQLHPKKEQETK
jgi:aspartate oxidase